VVPWRVIGIMLVVGVFVLIGLWSSFGRVKKSAKRLRGKKT
jgi:predicted histidine transporter YuiF (NhaC family)